MLTNLLADTGMWSASTGEPSKAFPDDVQKGLAVGVMDMEAYGKALRMFHKKHGCLVDPWPEELVEPVNQSIGEYLRCSRDVRGVFFLMSIFLCADSLPVGSPESCVHEASSIVLTAFVFRLL